MIFIFFIFISILFFHFFAQSRTFFRFNTFPICTLCVYIYIFLIETKRKVVVELKWKKKKKMKSRSFAEAQASFRNPSVSRVFYLPGRINVQDPTCKTRGVDFSLVSLNSCVPTPTSTHPPTYTHTHTLYMLI